ncbi:MAG: epoxyqueuosine reductase QueH, partial [Thermodesulfobacteriota bacterium]|nr:epoxyqueuosine reductase QueH [Thermodesulfobacteriota bacterium]
MPKILLHVCCGPCALYPVRTLRDQGFEVTGLFYNPNIHPLMEYVRRRDALREVADKLDLPVIYKDEEYDPARYFREVAFREANRCFHCYFMRLERTASIARRGKFDAFTTTLLYSKFQKHDQIVQLGLDLAGGGELKFHSQDFREGWKQGIDLSREWGIYRQQYCGCLYSEIERYQ